MQIPQKVVDFLERQSFVIIATLNADNTINTSVKGIVDIERRGKIFILDLYKWRTYKNIGNNPNVSITSVDESHFRGYSLSGKAKIVEKYKFPPKLMERWNKKIASRISARIIKCIKGEGARMEGIPESDLPEPEYLIEVDIRSFRDLAPSRLRK